MKQRLCAGLLASLITLLPGQFATAQGAKSVAGVKVSKDFDLQGHRGARGLLPENTLAGFTRALKIGVTTLELDLGITKDGVVVIHHDAYLNPGMTRNSNGEWVKDKSSLLGELDYAELSTFDVGEINPDSSYAKRFPFQKSAGFQKIPKLSDLFELVAASGNTNVRFNIETKLAPGQDSKTVSPERFVSLMLEVIKAHKMQTRVAIQSFDWRTLQLVQKQAPGIPTVYLTAQQRWLDNIGVGQAGTTGWTAGFDVDDHNGSVPELVKAAGGKVWSPYHRELTEKLVSEAHELGLKVIPWTVNNPKDVRKIIAMDVDGLITDYPNLYE